MEYEKQVEKIRSDWSTLDDLCPNLQKLSLIHEPSAEISDGHCTALRRNATNLKATKVARRNAHRLAKGYRDLAIITQEPADYEDVVDHTDPGGLPPTIDFLSRQLSEASGTRNWGNTCILDMRT